MNFTVKKILIVFQQLCKLEMKRIPLAELAMTSRGQRRGEDNELPIQERGNLQNEAQLYF